MSSSAPIETTLHVGNFDGYKVNDDQSVSYLPHPGRITVHPAE